MASETLATEGGTQAGLRKRTVVARKKALSAKKACTMLHEGTVHGQAITDKQRRFFGARCNG